MRRSLLHDATSGAWLAQFGRFEPSGPNTIDVLWGEPVNGLFHAEAHHAGVLGADFIYSAVITADWKQPGLRADLQFRISDEGRYGVRLREGTIAFYRFMLKDRECDPHPAVIAPCVLWPADRSPHDVDLPVECVLRSASFDKELATLRVTIVAEGSLFTISFASGSKDLDGFEVNVDEDVNIGVGRFGIYALAPHLGMEYYGRRSPIRFSELAATTDPTAMSNFALLYSTPGYDINGTKRALVRTLNDIEPGDYDDAGSSFTVTNAAGEVTIPERHFEAAGPSGSAVTFRRTLGIQFLAADFTDLRKAGTYTIEARVATSTGVRELRSRPFAIRSRLITKTMLWPLSILNAQARAAADEDFRRNWLIESGAAAWSVGLDGAFIADRADDQAGAVLRRIPNMTNIPLTAMDFRLVASITIVAGCAAQLQFRINPDERWAVTLQAGAAAGCSYDPDGPGAVRLESSSVAKAVPSVSVQYKGKQRSCNCWLGLANTTWCPRCRLSASSVRRASSGLVLSRPQ